MTNHIDKLYTESLIDIILLQTRFENQELEIQNLETEIQISNSENQNPVSKTGKLECKN